MKTDKLPSFKQIRIKEIEPAVDALLMHNRAKLKKLLKQKRFNWDNLMSPLEEMEDHLHKMWSPISHLNAVKNSPGLRKAYNRCLPKLTHYYAELSQNGELYNAIKTIKNSAAYKKLNTQQKRVIHNELRDFKLSGVNLPEKKKKRFKELEIRHAQLTQKFSENVLDATHAWTYQVKSKKQLAGLPEHLIHSAKQLAKKQKKSGWLLSLDFPVYHVVMTYADHKALRKVFYNAYVTRASDLGPTAKQFNNTEIMADILNIRQELATLVGFNAYADYSLATKMAKKPQEVLAFLNLLAKKTNPTAQKELRQLKQFAKKQFRADRLEAWDIAYYSEKLQQHKFSISQEKLRPYFQESKVLHGMFHLAEKLYGITIKEKKGVETWHKDVRFFEIYEGKNLRGGFYTDLYTRHKKNGGAWMDECQSRRRLNQKQIQLPIAYLTCNFSKPTKKHPSLLTHHEVTTLFHEFGHCLHHLLTKMDYAEIAGISGVEWDAVELPSQLMENFCWEPTVLHQITEHYKTKKKLPPNLLTQLINSKNFQAGLQMIRQLIFGLFDFELHMKKHIKDCSQIQATLNNVRKKLEVFPTPKNNRFQNSFTHIFAGGYAAGYYSYKWAEVLSCDAFEKFKEHGVVNRQVGLSFLHHILEKGGSQNAMALFKKFRGRKPTIDALLKDCGITK